MKILKDEDRMPFGKYKEERMMDIPASYFHWLWFNGMKGTEKTSNVAEYIHRNISTFQTEEKRIG